MIINKYLEMAKEVEIVRREENLNYEEAYERVKSKYFGREEDESNGRCKVDQTSHSYV